MAAEIEPVLAHLQVQEKDIKAQLRELFRAEAHKYCGTMRSHRTHKKPTVLWSVQSWEDEDGDTSERFGIVTQGASRGVHFLSPRVIREMEWALANARAEQPSPKHLEAVVRWARANMKLDELKRSDLEMLGFSSEHP